MVAVAAVAGIAAPFAIPAVLGAVGFGAAGVAAGSIAAGIQAGIGNVVAGSTFATLQSVAAAGFSSGAASIVGGTAAGTLGGIATAVSGISTTSGANILASSTFMNAVVPYVVAAVGDWVYERLF